MAKLKLRLAREEDAETIFQMQHEKEYEKYMPERLLFESIEDAKKEIRHFIHEAKRGNIFYFAVLKGKETIGILDLYKISKKDRKASIGYGLMPSQWGKGYGSETCKLGIEYAKKKLKLHSLEATADPNNKASQRVLEKNGFVKLGRAKDYYFDRGKFIDRELYWKILE